MTANMMAGALAALLALTFGGLAAWDLAKGLREGAFAQRGPSVVRRDAQPVQFQLIVLSRVAVVLAAVALAAYGGARFVGIID